jgi:hypothetical protein
LTALLVCLAFAGSAAAIETKDWQLSPYRVHVTIAVDAELRPQPDLVNAIQQSLKERIDLVIAPLWLAELSVAEDSSARRQCFEPREIPWESLTPELKELDKLLWMGVRVTPRGYKLTAREFDVYTRRWGTARERIVAQTTYLEQCCFDLLADVFTPLALIEPIADNDAQVQLLFRGAGLPRRDGSQSFAIPGEAFQPLLRRTDRTGRLIENGVIPVPWTYLTLTGEGGNALADVHTGARRPFAMKRGRVEQLAIALRYPPGMARVRFHARRDETQGLAGYEVYRAAKQGSPEYIGVTDRNGEISVPPADDGGVSMILLRSEGQLLAKAPVPSGSGPLLETPIAEDMARLRAQSEARVVREQLVDVVARRAIMIARIRSLLEKNRLDDAKKLMAELDMLPTSSVFSRAIDAAAKRTPETGDPMVQRSIERMFTTTQDLLGKFLDRRPIIDLQSQVNAARTKAPSAGDEPAQEL